MTKSGCEDTPDGKWGESVAVTPAGRDCYKTAVAVDGDGRTWVFWSENQSGNFDIFARAVGASGAMEQVQISKEPGSDIDPVAATDASGRVWVAWQGWRNGVAGIYTAHQEGKGFTKPAKVSNSNQNEWDPAIAADKTGRVAVAWDSYRNGNYDVYARIWAASAWGDEIPIAATARYEAYPSIAYDPGGRLWIAYEEGGQGWGKEARRGSASRVDRIVPRAQHTLATRMMATPDADAPLADVPSPSPASRATPARPTMTPAHGSQPIQRRVSAASRTSSHSGTVATSSDAKPDGTVRSPTDSAPLPPSSSRIPTTTQASQFARRGRSVVRASGEPLRIANGKQDQVGDQVPDPRQKQRRDRLDADPDGR